MTAEVTLSLRGRQVGATIRKSRLTGTDRRAAVQQALLQWLASGAEPDEVGEFVGHEAATSARVASSEDEIRRAAYALVYWQLVTSTKASTHHVLRPRITHQGRRAADVSKNPQEFVRTVGGHKTSDHSSGISVTGGSDVAVEADDRDNAMMAAQSVTTDSRIRVMAKATEVLGVLGERDSPAVSAAIEAFRGEAASPGPTVSSLKDKVRTATVTAVSAGVGQQIVEGLVQLGQLIT